jgi:GntR family transcriptional regulator
MSMHTTIAPSLAFAGPLYVQVAGILRAKICSSEWTARAPLPNEVTLARDIGVSIGTVRKALEMLENERLIQRRQGRGTYVLETSDESELERFSNLVAGGRKLRADRAEWSCAAADATDEEARVLALPRGARVYRLETRWTSGDNAVVVENISVAEALFPGLPAQLADGGQFLFPIYRRRYQQVITKVTEAITCVNADAVLAQKLNVPAGQAVLQVVRVAYGMSGAAVEISRRAVHLQRAEYAVTMT